MEEENIVDFQADQDNIEEYLNRAQTEVNRRLLIRDFQTAALVGHPLRMEDMWYRDGKKMLIKKYCNLINRDR